MSKDLIISKYKELVGAYKNYSDALMDGFNNDMGGAPYPEHWDGEIERIAKELSLLQEQEKTPIEQMKEAFKPIQMGANMVVDQSGIREDTFKKNLIIKPTYCTGVSTAVETYHVVDGQGTVWFQGTYIDCQEYLKSNQ